MTTSSLSLSSASRRIWSAVQSKEVRWATGGYLFFIAENAVLSENRTFLIEKLNDDNYHKVYGVFSTAATGTIAYVYYKLTRGGGGFGGGREAASLSSQLVPRSPNALAAVASWTAMTLGLIMASQALPKLQIPFSFSNQNSTDLNYSGSNSSSSDRANGNATGSSFQLQVRCPFDFSEKNTNPNDIYGMDRVSRHSGLWSLALVGIGNSLLLYRPLPLVGPPTPASSVLWLWWLGPAAVALLGGMHTDSRFRRNMGGTLDPLYDSQTSNVPFAAMLAGRQPSGAFQDLCKEIKPLNATIATIASTAWIVARRGR